MHKLIAGKITWAVCCKQNPGFQEIIYLLERFENNHSCLISENKKMLTKILTWLTENAYNLF